MLIHQGTRVKPPQTNTLENDRHTNIHRVLIVEAAPITEKRVNTPQGNSSENFLIARVVEANPSQEKGNTPQSNTTENL